MSVLELTMYTASTGAIVRCLSGPRALLEAVPQTQPGEGQIEGTFDGTTHYIDITKTPPEVATKTALPAPNKTSILGNGVDAAEWSGLPNPTSVLVSGDVTYSGVTTDGTLDLTMDAPGSCVVRLDGGAPYLVQTVTINAS